MDTCMTYSRHVAQGLLLALESLPTLTGTISSIGDKFNFDSFWTECHSKKGGKCLHKVPLNEWTGEFVRLLCVDRKDQKNSRSESSKKSRLCYDRTCQAQWP